MEPREHIELTIQLPVEELGRFSQLLEQVRQLMAGGAPYAAASQDEAATSGIFDNDRFQKLSLHQVQTEVRTETSPLGVKPTEMAETAEASAARAVFSSLEEASHPAEAPAQADRSAATAQSATEPPQNSSLQDAAESRTDSRSEQGEAQLPPDLPQEHRDTPELSVPAAGYDLLSQLPDASGGSWGGAHEELAFPGPAPLTAEAVSLAFQRDDRRYDNGFPLY